MIYDPERVDMAMDENGKLFYRAKGTLDGKPYEEWRPLQEIPKRRRQGNSGDDFTRPSF